MRDPVRRRWTWWVAAAAAAALVLGLGYGLRWALRPSAAPSPPGQVPVSVSPSPAGPIQLHDASAETGIAFQHTDGSSGRHYIIEAMSTGLATLDYDGDGLIDIYFPNGAPLPGTRVDKPPHHHLYKNLGGWRFKDVTQQAGVGSSSYGLGVTVGDYDNDGLPDIYLSNFGPNVLYHNNGDGTFTDVTAKAGVGRGDKVGAGVCLLDMDGDGWLDLYVGNYIEFTFDKHIQRFVHGNPSYPSPRDYTPVPDTLFRNNGDGTFHDVSRESGIAAHAGRSMGLVAADYDNDGATDVFVLNDVQPNFLFHNNGKGRFEEAGLNAGVAFGAQGETLANMGPDCGDYNNDGLLDFFTTNYQNQLPMLLRNVGGGMFEDVARATNAGAGCLPYVNWGCGLVDLDNDGHKDIFIANGHTEDNIERWDRTTSYKAPNILLWNNGQGSFVDVSATAGDGMRPVHAARGTAFDDLDNDGDLDVVVLNSRERPTILRNLLNESGSRNHWLQVRLQGVKTNRDGVGARVIVVAGDLRQTDEMHSGRGYQSHWGSRLHFGLGRHDRIDRIEVRWNGGGVDVLDDVRVDQQVTITEGSRSS